MTLLESLFLLSTISSLLFFLTNYSLYNTEKINLHIVVYYMIQLGRTICSSVSILVCIVSYISIFVYFYIIFRTQIYSSSKMDELLHYSVPNMFLLSILSCSVWMDHGTTELEFPFRRRLNTLQLFFYYYPTLLNHVPTTLEFSFHHMLNTLQPSIHHYLI